MTGGVSQAAVYLEQEYNSGMEQLVNAHSFPYRETRERLGRALADVEDDIIITDDVIETAMLFIKSMPAWISSPDIDCEPDGNILFEWHVNQSLVLDVSIGRGVAYYSALLGPYDERRGRCAIHDTFPPVIANLVSQLRGTPTQQRVA
jgi:hypothetical protein